jgi:hypothetical protein
MMETNRKYLETRDSLLNSIGSKSYSGYDPFDGLNSRMFQVLGLSKSPLTRLTWIQFLKRSPFNFRRFVGVSEARNPKGIALVVLGLLLDYRSTGNSALLEEATKLGDWLLSQRSDPDVWGAAAWGYHFDWQARAFFVPKGKPNIITTVYVALAMNELARATGLQRFADAVFNAAEFIATRLYVDNADGPYFRYIPGESVLVHNANLWGSALVAQVGTSHGRSEWLNLARKACITSIKAQDERGAWPYGKRGHHSFVDSFHTGFNLEALQRYSAATGSDEFSGSIERGLAYYREHMFLPDGTPKYYDNQTYPIDMHTTAQAVITLLEVSGNASDADLARKVLDWSIDNMYDYRKNYFHYQKRKFWTNKIRYMRWTQAWMYYAITRYIYFNKEKRARQQNL